MRLAIFSNYKENKICHKNKRNSAIRPDYLVADVEFVKDFTITVVKEEQPNPKDRKKVIKMEGPKTPAPAGDNSGDSKPSGGDGGSKPH